MIEDEVRRLYVDANIIIHLVEHNDDLAAALTDLFTAQSSGRPFLVTSELTAIYVSTAIGMLSSHLLTADRRLANRYELTHHRYGLAKGPAAVEVLRPELEVVRQLAEVASR